MAIRYVVLDFDGTCTQVDKVQQQFLDEYRSLIEPAFGKLSKDEWESALASVKQHSPHVGWMISGTSSAPAYADPYIASGEAANLLVRRHDPDGSRKLAQALPNAYSPAYAKYPAPWRDEVPQVLAALVELGLKVGFISNSDTTGLKKRLDTLLGADSPLRSKIQVQGNANKYRIQELAFDPPGPAERHRPVFEALPAAKPVKALRRPAYLRRGNYFESLCSFWQSFGDDSNAAADTLVCGDVWELDLALPAALGAHVHLITRAGPYDTCEYERAQVAAEDVTPDLRGLVEHARRLK